MAPECSGPRALECAGVPRRQSGARRSVPECAGSVPELIWGNEIAIWLLLVFEKMHSINYNNK